LLRALRSARFRLITSAQQRRELERALRRPRIAKYGVGQTEIASLLRLLQRRSDVIVPLDRPPLPLRDPNDAHILGIAAHGRADYIVTGDKDLLVLADDPRLGALRIVTVAQFLAILEAIEQAATAGPTEPKDGGSGNA
jgi:putative PIN family toxin of toxin-antitoxin system